MVDTRGARRDQARNILRDGVVFDSSVLLQFKGTLYKGITEHRTDSSIVRYMMTPSFFRSPANVVTIFGDSVALFDVLQMRTSQPKEGVAHSKISDSPLPGKRYPHAGPPHTTHS